jgi:hypothetical protein
VITDEVRRVAKAQGIPLPPQDGSVAAPSDPLQSESDFMADGVGRMLNAVLLHALKGNSRKAIDAPWMASVIAAGASPKLVSLMAPFTSRIKSDSARLDAAVSALGFFTQSLAGTGASLPTSKPSKASKTTKAPRPVYPASKRDDAASGFTARARTQGTCVECESQVPRLKWCSGCYLAGYCGAKCQKSAWGRHKKHCLPYTKWAAFVKHVMAVQTEPFLAGPWAGQLPSDVWTHSSQPTVPIYSRRQLSLQEYIMMLAVTEMRFSTAEERQAATDGADGVSQHGVVTWIRAGVVAAVHAHGPKLRICDRAICSHCCVVWRQTTDARVCQMCNASVAMVGLGQPIGPPTTQLWLRRVVPDPQTGEPRLHLAEIETCSEKCKKTLLTAIGRDPSISKNDCIDSVDALVKEPSKSSNIPVTIQFD